MASVPVLMNRQILQHLQSQATEKMEILTTSMRRDSHTVRIIAFLTFLYLPATFVSVDLISNPFFDCWLTNLTDILQYGYREVSKPSFRP